MATQDRHEVAVKTDKPTGSARARELSPFADFDRFFETLMPRALTPWRWERGLVPELGALQLHAPRVDVVDRDGEIVVKAEIPGVDKKDLQVSLAGNLLTIKGETKHEEKEEKGDYYRCEISRGAFSRSVLLPAEVDDKKAKAEMTDGMLEITLPKLAKEAKRDIKIG